MSAFGRKAVVDRTLRKVCYLARAGGGMSVHVRDSAALTGITFSEPAGDYDYCGTNYESDRD
jgi:hypothetical protein